MKSIKEKAKAYDEAIKRAQAKMEEAKVFDYDDEQTAHTIRLTTTDIFPELKESDGEKIRKLLIEAVIQVLQDQYCSNRGVSKEKVVAWLEKQGNLMKALQISNAKIGELIEKNYYLKEQLEKQGNNMGISEVTKQELEDNLNKALEKETPESWNKFLDEQGEQKMKTPEESLGIDSDTYNKIVDECIYGEQKPADKVKPKFKVGDWVVYCNDDVDLITGIEENGYRINNGGYIPFICENEMRLWDITDAKVGDVLVSESTCGLGTWYCIFKSLDDDESMTVHCYLARDGRFETKKELCFDKDPYNTKPATKEQRETLMKAMADAGYEWDAENRQLRKIEPRQDELTEFEKAVKQVLKEAIECGDTHNLKADADMLLRLVQKPAEAVKWSPQEESYICQLESLVKEQWRQAERVHNSVNIKKMSELMFFLKTLNPNKKPQRILSAEAKEALYNKPAWSEEDENRINRLIAYFEDEESFTAEDDIVYVNWLKFLKDRVQPQPKQEWSEEDDALLYGVIETEQYMLDVVTGVKTFDVGNEQIESQCTKELAWLKILKDRCTWKPSDEQMDVLNEVIRNPYLSTAEYNGLVALREQFKAL